jgi:hypothetical protein
MVGDGYHSATKQESRSSQRMLSAPIQNSMYGVHNFPFRVHTSKNLERLKAGPQLIMREPC